MQLCLMMFWIVLLSGQPEDANIWFRLAWQSFEKQEWEKARSAAKRALTINPRLADAEVVLGLVSVAQERFKEAEGHFQSALSLQTKNHLAQGYLASLYLRQRRYSEASLGFKKVLQINPHNVSALYNLGVIALAEEKLPDALKHFTEAAALKPSDVECRIGMLESQVLLNREADVRVSLKTIESLIEPQDPRYFKVATMLAFHQRYSYAIPLLERIHRRSPNVYEVSYNFALAQFNASNYDKAVDILSGLPDRLRRAESYNLVGLVEEKRQRQIEARLSFRKAAALEPTNEDYRIDYGSNLLQHRPPQEAVDEFTKGVSDFPASWRMRLGLGCALYLAGKYDESVRSLLEASKLQPDADVIFFTLGKSYEFAGSVQKQAISGAFEAYLRKSPNDPWAYFHYATISFLRQADSAADFSVAKSNLERALALDERFPEAHLQLGIIAEREGKTELAVQSFLHAIQLHPRLGSAHYRLALAYQRLGERVKAQAEFKLFEKLKLEGDTNLDKQRVVQSLVRRR